MQRDGPPLARRARSSGYCRTTGHGGDFLPVPTHEGICCDGGPHHEGIAMRRTILSLLLSLSVTGTAWAQVASNTETPTREHFAPPGWEASYHDWHYSPVVKSGDMVIVSGIPAARGETYEAKVRWMFEQLKAHLAAADATLADVVELTSFHAAPKDTAQFREELEKLGPIHREYFPDHYPAWTAVGTTVLLSKDAPVELRAMAIIGSGKRPKADIARPSPAKAD